MRCRVDTLTKEGCLFRHLKPPLHWFKIEFVLAYGSLACGR